MSPWVWTVDRGPDRRERAVRRGGIRGRRRPTQPHPPDERRRQLVGASGCCRFSRRRPALDRYVGVSQIGITLSSLILGAYAQATLSDQLTAVLGSWFDLTRNDGPVGRDRTVLVSSQPSSSSSASSCRRPSRCSIPTADRARDGPADAVVALRVPAVHRACSTARRSCSFARLGSTRAGASAPPLAGRDRSAHRREPRWRAARTRGTATAASRAPSRTPARPRPDGRAATG